MKEKMQFSKTIQTLDYNPNEGPELTKVEGGDNVICKREADSGWRLGAAKGNRSYHMDDQDSGQYRCDRRFIHTPPSPEDSRPPSPAPRRLQRTVKAPDG